MKSLLYVAFGLVIGAALGAGAMVAHLSTGGAGPSSAAPAAPYAGQQERAVASLSEEDIADLSAGRGWGLAKPAELNGYPGPAHLLELADEIDLSAEQRAAVEQIFAAMQKDAQALGARLIDAERALDEIFRSGSADGTQLSSRLAAAEELRAMLREAHLAAHLAVTPLLSHQQRMKYASLRGYGGGHSGHMGH